MSRTQRTTGILLGLGLLLPALACEPGDLVLEVRPRREQTPPPPPPANYVLIGKDARWREPRPDLPDLSVQFISRTPRFPGIQPDYVDIENDIDGEGPTGPVRIVNAEAQRRPRAGQVIVFTTIVRNVGTQPIGGFDWAWLYDGRDVHEGFRREPLDPGQAASFVFVHSWEDGPHHIAFQVDRDRLVEETSEENNWVIDRTDALSLAFFVEQSVADFFTTVRGGLGSYSFEDWAQFQVRQMNKEFRDTIYPSCPGGILERVRLDAVYRIPDGWGNQGGTHTPGVVTPVNLDQPALVDANAPPADVEFEVFNNMIGGVDGVWGFSAELMERKPEWDDKNFYEFHHRWLTGSEWPLHHELGHQLGRVDHYLLPSDAQANKAVPGLAYQPPADYRDGMMFTGNHAHDVAIGKNTRKWDSTYRFYSEHVARSFNRDQGVRRGLFGEYLFDVPKRNTFAFVDGDGRPVADATVEVFVAKGRGWTNPGFNAEPNFTGRTTAHGMFTLDRSPWNHVFIGSTNGVVLFRVTPASHPPMVGFLDISHFNLAYWRGHEDAARFTVKLSDLPAN
ncbi:MAG: hypothetical protein IH986_05705 [Planctomycetes bacterium]|nr:hypothetical protein [Planctomycetota bacterium]